MKAKLKCVSQLKKIYGLKFEVRKNLKNLNSFKIDGIAQIFVQPNNLEHFIRCFHVFEKNNVPFCCIGNGTNMLVPNNYDGAVIRIAENFSEMKFSNNVLVASSGALLNKIVIEACRKGYKGLEDAFGIPGTIGGAIYMNASAYGFRISDYVSGVLAMVDGKIKEFSNEECEFGYRTSVFQRLKNVIILEVNLKFDEKDEPNKLLKNAIKTMQKRKFVQPIETKNAGSVFKNPVEFSAGKLIEELGLKGFNIGGAKVSEKHANFIENFNNATFSDIVDLIKYIKNKVFEKYKIELDVEIQVLGENNDFW